MLTWKMVLVCDYPAFVNFLAFHKTNHHKFKVQKFGTHPVFGEMHWRSSLFMGPAVIPACQSAKSYHAINMKKYREKSGKRSHYVLEKSGKPQSDLCPCCTHDHMSDPELEAQAVVICLGFGWVGKGNFKWEALRLYWMDFKDGELLIDSGMVFYAPFCAMHRRECIPVKAVNCYYHYSVLSARHTTDSIRLSYTCLLSILFLFALYLLPTASTQLLLKSGALSLQLFECEWYFSPSS